jgi:hypothetical protein
MGNGDTGVVQALFVREVLVAKRVEPGTDDRRRR